MRKYLWTFCLLKLNSKNYHLNDKKLIPLVNNNFHLIVSSSRYVYNKSTHIFGYIGSICYCRALSMTYFSNLLGIYLHVFFVFHTTESVFFSPYILNNSWCFKIVPQAWKNLFLKFNFNMNKKKFRGCNINTKFNIKRDKKDTEKMSTTTSFFHLQKFTCSWLKESKTATWQSLSRDVRSMKVKKQN